jgi:hypothetical protein
MATRLTKSDCAILERIAAEPGVGGRPSTAASATPPTRRDGPLM